MFASDNTCELFYRCRVIKDFQDNVTLVYVDIKVQLLAVVCSLFVQPSKQLFRTAPPCTCSWTQRSSPSAISVAHWSVVNKQQRLCWAAEWLLIMCFTGGSR